MPDDLLQRLSRERGIGRVLAGRLIDTFGEDLAAMASADEAQLLGVPGLGGSRVSAVRQALSLLADLSAPVAPVPVGAVEIETDGGPSILVRLPSIQLDGDVVEVRGPGLKLRLGLGDTLSMQGTWDGTTTDDDDCAVIEWQNAADAWKDGS